MKLTLVARVVLAGGLVAAAAIAVAGPLNPPGGLVAPTFKTLSEVEPRIAVQSLPGAAGGLYAITEPGSYYLTGDISVPDGMAGILIQAERVTLDLMGFSIVGETGSLAGITASAYDATVRNGNILTCEGGGVILSGGGHLVERVRVVSSGTFGISAGARSKIVGCVVHACGVGFAFDNATTLERCEAYGNTRGFDVAATCTLRDCLANGNFGDGFNDLGYANTYTNCVASYNSGRGFSAGPRAALTSCQAITNSGVGILATTGGTLMNCAATGGGSHGIQVESDCLVQDCHAEENSGDAITAAQRNRIRRCSVSRSPNATGNGIRLTGAANLVDHCSAVFCRRGVLVESTGNKIVRTTCSANSVNWEVTAGNQCYVYLPAATGAAVFGNSGGTAASVTDPEANYSY